GHELRKQRVGSEAAAEAGRADHLLCTVELRLHAEAALGNGVRDRLVPVRPGRVRRRDEATQERGPLLSAGAPEAAQAAFGEVAPLDIERPPRRLAAPHG